MTRLPQPVGVLAAGLPISRPAVCQHLKVLKDVGLVVDRKAGPKRLHQVEPAALDPLRASPDQMRQRALESYAAEEDDGRDHHA